MEQNIRIESWCGYDIRFVEVKGEWYAVLKDICDALGLRTDKVAQRLEPSMLERVVIETKTNIPSKYIRSNKSSNVVRLKDDHPSKGVNFSNEYTKRIHMLAVNEIGIYEALFASRRLEARKFRRWSAGVMQKLRNRVGLKQYEVMRMTEPEIQNAIDELLDRVYWDEEKEQLMESITVRGGDVEQVPFE